jgi:hypothetical protein
VQEALGGRSRRQASRTTLEQPNAELVFELTQGTAYRRLSQVQ